MRSADLIKCVAPAGVGGTGWNNHAPADRPHPNLCPRRAVHHRAHQRALRGPDLPHPRLHAPAHHLHRAGHQHHHYRLNPRLQAAIMATARPARPLVCQAHSARSEHHALRMARCSIITRCNPGPSLSRISRLSVWLKSKDLVLQDLVARQRCQHCMRVLLCTPFSFPH